MGRRTANENAHTTLDHTALDHASRNQGGWWAALLSAIALVVSGVSLWETVLRQADLTVYAGDNIGYTLDPYGSYEVVAVPVTIANGGAQDSAVMKLSLDVRNLGTKEGDRFDGAFIADPRYFGEVDDVTTGKRRTKVPFAPLAVAGRGAYTGTVLFYPSQPRVGSRDPLLAKDADLEVTMTVQTPPATSWLDKLFGVGAPAPIRLRLHVPPYNPGALLTGELVRLKPAT